jgi:hypothetical protein
MSDAIARINEYRAAVVAAVSTAMPFLRECEEQFGRFNLDELERESVKTPAVRVAVLKAKVTNAASGHADAMLSCAAFVITDGKDRDAAGWTIAEAVAVLLHSSQLFGLTRLGAPSGVEIMPALTVKLKQRAVSLIAVEWNQEVRQLGATIFDEGHVLEELYVNDEEVDLDELAGGGGEGA